MNVEIINIGDELLIGQVVNTNASWMAEQLSLSGFRVRNIRAIEDVHEEIKHALEEAEKRAEIVLISGGIGPTRDDITKTTLCEFFETRLVFDADAYRDIELIFGRRGYPVTELNRQQAELPEKCTGIPNTLGTARGMWFEKTEGNHGKKTIFVAMPGVPFEMKAMMELEIIPRLEKLFKTPAIFHKTVLTQGVGESFLAAQIEQWENELPPSIRLAYLPQPGIVRLRLTGLGQNDAQIRGLVEKKVKKLEALIPDYIFGTDQDTLEGILGRLLTEKGASLACAESCTGGYIAHLLTTVPGSSGYFKGSVVAYANEAKEKLLGVNPESLLRFGAVSEAVVKEMAIGAQSRLNADYVISTSGIAGPDGGTTDKPVGTIWIGIASPDEVFAQKFLFGDSRDRNIRRTALQAMNMLRKKILKSTTIPR